MSAALETAPGAPADLRQAETGGPWGTRVFLALLLLGPLTFVLERTGASASVLFVTAVLATVPLAGFLGRATEEIALRSSPTMGGFLNATLGNAIELSIAARLLTGSNPQGADIVRGSIVGSLVTNLLLLVGLSAFAGGLKFKEQRFNPAAAGVSSSLLIIAFAGLSIPTIYFHFVTKENLGPLSYGVSGILAALYAAGVVFTFMTHRHLFDATEDLAKCRAPEWSLARSIAVLAAVLLAVGWLTGVLERTIEDAGRGLHLTKPFVGVIVIGVITNVAENLSAIRYARRNMIDLSMQIGLSSAIQIVLFVVPVLVLIGAISGHPFEIHFTLFELACMLLPVMITNHMAADGVCNWLEGLQLIALYAIIGVAFFFVR